MIDNFKSILGSSLPHKVINTEGKRFVKLLMEISVGKLVAGKSGF